MRIDDRKVNGRVLLDALDPVDGFNILVESTAARPRCSSKAPQRHARCRCSTARSKVLHYGV